MSVPNKIEGDDKNAFVFGKYFCFTSDVWGIQDKQFTSDKWKNFSRRKGAVEIPVRNRNATIDPYKLTRKALQTGTAPAPAKTMRSDNTSSSEVKKSIWPVDIVGEPKVVNKIHEVAHLLPAGEHDHEEWFGVAAAVLGLPQNSTVADQLMATRGVHTEGEENQDHATEVTKQKAEPKAARAPPQMPAKSSKPSPGKASMPPAHERQADSSSSEVSVNKNRKKRKKSRKRGRPGIQGKSPRAAKKGEKGNVTISPDASLAGSEKTRKQRVAHTGVVHFVSNKIRMTSQKHLLDGSNPTMLIIPCYTLQQAKDWKGEGYRAVILTGPPDFKGVPPPDGYSDRDLGKDAFCYARMNTETFLERYEKVRAVNKREQGRLLHTARQSLEDTILGLTQYVKDMTNQDLTPLCPSKRAALQQRANSLQDKTTIIPKHGKDPEKPLLLVTFGAQSETPRTSHPAPDPLLLLAKAATIWAKMTGTSLLAADEEEEIDSLDELAEEDFYQRFCQSQDAKIPKEISVLSPYINA